MSFWDSSAIIPLCVAEPLSETIRLLAKEDANLIVWWGTGIECCSSFARLRREGRLTTRDEDQVRDLLETLGECWSEIGAVEEVRTRARLMLLRHPLRAADSLQLAAALTWAGNDCDGLEFVCLDRRLRDAARKEGFTVLPQDMT